MNKPSVTPSAESFFGSVKLDKNKLQEQFHEVANKLNGSGRLNVAVIYLSGSVAWSGVSAEVPAGLWGSHLRAIGESQSGKVPALVVSTLGNSAAVGLDRDGTIYTPENHGQQIETAVLAEFWDGVNT